MSRYVKTLDRILVEMWVNGEKRFSVVVDEANIYLKVAECRRIAVRDRYEDWEVYVIRPAITPGRNRFDRRFTKEMQIKWNQAVKNIKN